MEGPNKSMGAGKFFEKKVSGETLIRDPRVGSSRVKFEGC